MDIHIICGVKYQVSVCCDIAAKACIILGSKPVVIDIGRADYDVITSYNRQISVTVYLLTGC